MNELSMTRSNAKILRRGSLIIYATACFYYLAFIARTGFLIGDTTYFSLFDDAMIAMRYARNLAEGHGLVWNNGEYIEGYTNFLWTLWMAVIHLVPVPESKISVLVAFSGAIILLVNINLVRKIAITFSTDPLVILPAMTLAAFNFGLIYWTLRGMEVGIITLFLNWVVLLALRLQQNFSPARLAQILVISGLMLLTRTDCVLLFMIMAGWVCFTANPARRVKTALLFAVTLILFMGGHTLFRILYYHDPLPNTFYLKVSGTPVQERIVRGLQVYFKWFVTFLIPVLIILFTGAATRLKNLMDLRFLLLLSPFLMMSAYSVYVGGDAWEWMPYANRYVTITIPLLMVLTVIVLGKITTGFRSSRVLMLLTGSFCLLWYLYMIFLLPPPGNGISGFYPTVVALFAGLKYLVGGLVFMLILVQAILFVKADHEKKIRIFRPGMTMIIMLTLFLCLEGLPFLHWFRFNALHVIDDRRMVKTGMNIQNLTSPETSIAVVWGGAIPYFAHRYTVDLMGKMDRTIAKSNSRLKEFYPGHTKWNYGFSLYKYHPDIVLQLFFKTPIEDQRIMAMGYDHIRENLFIRKGSYNKIHVPDAQANPQKLFDLIIRK